jgi:hypothetical protein
MNSHNGSLVPASITVIWCRPYSDELFIEHVLEAFLHKLMSSSDKIE